MDSPATVVVTMLLIMATTSQLPGTSHCTVMSKSSNVSNWCDGRVGQCQLIPQEGLELLEPDDDFRHMVELDDSNYQETRRVLVYFDPYVTRRVQINPGQSAVLCDRKPYSFCPPPPGAGNPEHCNMYKKGGC